MTPEQHAAQVQLVSASLRLSDDQTARHGVYAVRASYAEVLTPPVPLFASEPFKQMRGQTSMPTDQL